MIADYRSPLCLRLKYIESDYNLRLGTNYGNA